MSARLLLLCLLPAALALSAVAQPRALDVYWTDSPPVMDGKMDDACWSAAEVAGDFTVSGSSNAAGQSTEVRFAYDAAQVYVFWHLYETNMADLCAGGPATVRDQYFDYQNSDRKKIDRAGVRFFHYVRIDTGPLPVWHHFTATPTGAREDHSSRAWSDYTPDWQCVAGRFEGGWTLELSIPFDAMAEDGLFVGTPQPGEKWDTQLFRTQVSAAEDSHWDPEGDAPWMRIHSPQGWGNLFFRGRKDGEPLPVVSATRVDLCRGRGALTGDVHGASSPVQGECRVYRDDREIAVNEVSLPEGNGAVVLPYQLLDAGEYLLSFALRDARGTFFSGAGRVTLPLVEKLFQDRSAELRAGRALVAEDRHPAFAGIRAALDDLESRNRTIVTTLGRSSELTAGEWRQLEGECRAFADRLKPLQFDLNLARLYPGRAGSAPLPFAVGTATESDKLYPDTLYAGLLTSPIRLALAGNEYGSFQLAVLPFWEDLEVASVSCSPLRGAGDAVIPADTFRWFRIGYVKLETRSRWERQYERDHEPDPLLPGTAFNVPRGALGAVWADVQVPEGTPEGVYTGTVTVTAGGQSVARPLEVRCYGFDIPRRSSLENEFWLTPGHGWRRFYGSLNYTPELHARHAAVLGRYRVSSFPCDWTLLCGQVPIYVEPDGRFTFDWTVFDRYVQTAWTHGTTAFWSALSCNSGWTVYLHSPTTRVIERATGTSVALGKYLPTGITNSWDLARLPYRENRVYRDFLQAYVTHLKELGVNDRSYYELFDEPSGERFAAMLDHHRYLREVVPELRLLDFGVDPTRTVAGTNAVGLMDTWAPHLDRLDDPAVRDAMRGRQTDHGEKCWAYTCVETCRDADGKRSYSASFLDEGYSPFCLYHRPYIALRMHAWMAWHYHLDGIFIYALCDVPEANCGKAANERWPATEWSDARLNGSGTLVYPGPDYELIPSMRLACIREGLEDYEYFALLRAEAAKLDPVRDAALLAKVNTALSLDETIVASPFVWAKNPAVLDARRERVAALIREVRVAVGPR